MDTLRWILEQRLEYGPIPAAEFMALALYHPEHGYYRSAKARWGFEGADYFTALDCGPLLGETLALRFQTVWEQLGRPEVFTVLEAGAGRGWLGRDLLCAADRPFASSLRYVHCDDHPAARATAEKELAPFLASGKVRFLLQGETIEPFIGAVLSNELFDALPTQPWRWDGKLWSRQSLGKTGPCWEPCDPGQAGEWFEAQSQNGLQPGDGSVWCGDLPALIEKLDSSLEAGLFITIDYGDSAAWLLAKGAGVRRYRNHKSDEHWWEDPGTCDITADLDFTRVAALLGHSGFSGITWTPLSRWIRTHAPLDRWEQEWFSLEAKMRVKRMENLLQLTMPAMMGDHFKVLEAWKPIKLREA